MYLVPIWVLAGNPTGFSNRTGIRVRKSNPSSGIQIVVHIEKTFTWNLHNKSQGTSRLLISTFTENLIVNLLNYVILHTNIVLFKSEVFTPTLCFVSDKLLKTLLS